MPSTGTPINTRIPDRGEVDWDDDVTVLFQNITAYLASVQTQLAAKADLIAGKLATGQLPAYTVNNTFGALNQAAMLALSTAQPGDAAIRADNGGSIWILTALPSSTLASWTQVNPSNGVISVNGHTGIITGLPELSINNTFTGIVTFTQPVVVANATGDTHAVNRGQMNTAISAATAGLGGSSAPYVGVVGDGSTLGYLITHGRGRAAVSVTCWDVNVSPPEVLVPDKITRTSSTVTVTFGDAPASNGVEVVVF